MLNDTRQQAPAVQRREGAVYELTHGANAQRSAEEDHLQIMRARQVSGRRRYRSLPLTLKLMSTILVLVCAKPASVVAQSNLGFNDLEVAMCLYHCNCHPSLTKAWVVDTYGDIEDWDTSDVTRLSDGK